MEKEKEKPTWTTEQVDKAIELAVKPLKQALIFILLVFSMFSALVMLVTFKLIFP